MHSLKRRRAARSIGRVSAENGEVHAWVGARLVYVVEVLRANAKAYRTLLFVSPRTPDGLLKTGFQPRPRALDGCTSHAGRYH